MEAVYWRRWLQSSISLWSGLVFHMSHEVGKQFRLSFCSITIFIVIVVVDLIRDAILCAIVSVSRIMLSAFSLSFLCFQPETVFSILSKIFAVVERRFGSVSFCVGSLLAHSASTASKLLSSRIIQDVCQSIHMCPFPNGPVYGFLQLW